MCDCRAQATANPQGEMPSSARASTGPSEVICLPWLMRKAHWSLDTSRQGVLPSPAEVQTAAVQRGFVKANRAGDSWHWRRYFVTHSSREGDHLGDVGKRPGQPGAEDPGGKQAVWCGWGFCRKVKARRGLWLNDSGGLWGTGLSRGLAPVVGWKVAWGVRAEGSGSLGCCERLGLGRVYTISRNCPTLAGRALPRWQGRDVKHWHYTD